MSTPRNQLLQLYRDAGFRLVKVTAGAKDAYEKQWGKVTHEPDDIPARDNIGLIFENGFIDLDFDTPEARKLSGWFFGKCPSFRRASLPASEPGHRIVHCSDHPGGKRVFKLCKDDADLMGKANILELRSSTEKRHHQTVVPPSRYVEACWRNVAGGFAPDAPRDELVWDRPFNKDSIPTWEWDTVVRAGAFLSLCAIALKHYPAEGDRDNYCLALAGALLSLGMAAADVDDLVEHVAKLAGDEERRGGKGTYTEARKDGGVQVNGLPGFLAKLGDSPTLEKTVRRWFGEDVRNRDGGRGKGIPAPPDAIALHAPRHIRTQLLEQALIAKGALIFRRFDTLVTPVLLTDQATIDGVTFPRDTVLLKPVEGAWVRFVCDELGIAFCDHKGNLAHPRMDMFDDLFTKVEVSGFPAIDGVSTTPTLNRNEPGYDPVSRRVLMYRPDVFPDAPLKPSRADAEAALARIRRPVRLYKWGNDYSEAVWLAAMLAGVVRPELPNCPVFGFDANKASSGKTILGRCVAIVSCGGDPPTMSFSENQVENAKKIFAALYRGATMLFIDNVPRGMAVDNDTLNQIVTSETFTDRVLGLSEMGTVSTRVLIVATGNDLTFAGDLVSRSCRCTVNPPSSTPEDLKYDFAPDDLVKRDRGKFVVDALTILRAYIHAGRPGEDQLPACRLAGFNLLRGALVWLGMPDPHAGLKDTREESPEMIERYRLLDFLVRHYEPGKEFRAWALADHEDMKKLLGAIGSGDPVRRVGRMLSRHRDMEMGGVAVRSRRDGPSGLAWWYEAAGEQDGVSIFEEAANWRARQVDWDRDDYERQLEDYKKRAKGL